MEQIQDVGRINYSVVLLAYISRGLPGRQLDASNTFTKPLLKFTISMPSRQLILSRLQFCLHYDMMKILLQGSQVQKCHYDH